MSVDLPCLTTVSVFTGGSSFTGGGGEEVGGGGAFTSVGTGSDGFLGLMKLCCSGSLTTSEPDFFCLLRKKCTLFNLNFF